MLAAMLVDSEATPQATAALLSYPWPKLSTCSDLGDGNERRCHTYQEGRRWEVSEIPGIQVRFRPQFRLAASSRALSLGVYLPPSSS